MKFNRDKNLVRVNNYRDKNAEKQEKLIIFGK